MRKGIVDFDDDALDDVEERLQDTGQKSSKDDDEPKVEGLKGYNDEDEDQESEVPDLTDIPAGSLQGVIAFYMLAIVVCLLMLLSATMSPTQTLIVSTAYNPNATINNSVNAQRCYNSSGVQVPCTIIHHYSIENEPNYGALAPAFVVIMLIMWLFTAYKLYYVNDRSSTMLYGYVFSQTAFLVMLGLIIASAPGSYIGGSLGAGVSLPGIAYQLRKQNLI